MPRPTKLGRKAKKAAEAKLKAVMLYMLHELAVPVSCAKLACLLFKAEYGTYRQTGHPLTGIPYVSGATYPYPKPFYKLLRQLRRQRHIVFHPLTVIASAAGEDGPRPHTGMLL